MKYLQNEDGIAISKTLANLIEKALVHAGRQSVLARLVGVPEASISRWRGASSSHPVASITWDQWAKLRAHFIDIGLIRDDDPRWMLPSQLRRVLLEKEADKLTEDEERLLQLFRMLSPTFRKLALASVKAAFDASQEDAASSSPTASTIRRAD